MEKNQAIMEESVNLKSSVQSVSSPQESNEINVDYDQLIEQSEKIINTSELEYKFRSGSPDD